MASATSAVNGEPSFRLASACSWKDRRTAASDMTVSLVGGDDLAHPHGQQSILIQAVNMKLRLTADEAAAELGVSPA
ncbi:hypothetical protein WDZ92_34150, partial [Nostoc sp. NIES-2111]